MSWQIRKSFTFDAAHQLPNHEGACRRLHGHTYKVEVVCEAMELVKTGSSKGMVVDFGDLKKSWGHVHKRLDHSLLNDTIENPTAERIAQFIFEHMLAQVPELVAVVVWETPTSMCEYRGRLR